MSKSIQIIIGSTRQNRLGAQVAEWVKTHAEAHDGINIEVIDLKEENLPFFDSPTPPMYAPDASPAGQAWAKKIDAGDGFIFVTPEYNRGIPASLKNALDFLLAEWQEKPAAVVSYGWIDGGASASKHLHDVLSWLKVATADSSVHLKLSGEIMAEDGSIADVNAAFKDYVAVLEAALAEIVAHERIAEPVAA
jgi:NAD(P)H-dependent FMN reductase